MSSAEGSVYGAGRRGDYIAGERGAAVDPVFDRRVRCGAVELSRRRGWRRIGGDGDEGVLQQLLRNTYKKERRRTYL